MDQVPVHSLVQDVVRGFLAAVDAEAPQLVEALYLTGSVALGDFRPRRSDIAGGTGWPLWTW